MTALAIGDGKYLECAGNALEKILREQIAGGLHRQGPGPGAVGFNDAANLMYALKRSGRRGRWF